GREYHVEHAPYGAQDRLAIVTNDQAVEFALKAAPTASPGLTHWRALVAYDERERLLSVDAFQDFLVLTLRSAGQQMVRVVDHEGATLRDLHPPAAGHVELA